MKRKKPKVSSANQDGVYFLKILLYMMLGLQWLWFVNTTGQVGIALPAGLITGLMFTRHERFQIDRKIEYAVLLVASLVGLLLEAGVYL